MVVEQNEYASAAAPEAADAGGHVPHPSRCVLGNISVDRMSMEDAATFVTHALLHRRNQPPRMIVGPNAQLVSLAQRNARFAEAMRTADLAPPDGISVVWALRLLGQGARERVPGGELMERLCAEAARCDIRVFLLGGLPGAAVMAAKNLQQRYPALQICGTYCPPLGFESDPAELAAIRREVNRAAPDLLCVAFGAPKQEIWMLDNREFLNVGAILSVGAALDTQAGLRRRAPRWLQKAGLEWLFRLLMEPRRLWRRYLLGNLQFACIVFRQAVRQGAGKASRLFTQDGMDVWAIGTDWENE